MKVVFDLALELVDGIQVTEWDSYELPLLLAEASLNSQIWEIFVPQTDWGRLPLVVVRRKRK